MSYLVRMIEIGHWSDENGNIISPDNYLNTPADGITRDLKSDNNTLSLWEIKDLSELREIAISMLTSRDSPQNLFIVAIPKDSITTKLEFENNGLAETAFKKFKNRHYDLLNLNLDKLKILTEIILYALQDENNLYDFVYINSKDFIKQLIKSGDIISDELKGKLKKDFKD